MIFLEKIRSLPERMRKIILWAILIVLASILLFFWISSVPEKIKQLNLPKIAIPQMPRLLNLNNIKTNAPEETQVQEN